jgi:hypothetical protein
LVWVQRGKTPEKERKEAKPRKPERKAAEREREKRGESLVMLPVLDLGLLVEFALVAVVVEARRSSDVDGVLVPKEDGDLLERLVSSLWEEEEDDDGVDDVQDDEQDPVL